MIWYKLILLLILSSFGFAQNQTYIAKIELPSRLLNMQTFEVNNYITRNIICETRIPLTQTQPYKRQELWILKISTPNIEEKINYLENIPFIIDLEPIIYAEGQSLQATATLSSTPFYLKDPSLNLLKTLGTKEIIVALLDTGIDRNHSNLTSSIHINTTEIMNGIDDDNNGYIDDRYGYDFTNESPIQGDPTDTNGHGTHLAGIIAAKKNNLNNFEGVSKKVKLLNIKCLNRYNEGSQINMALAIRYAVDNGAHIINCSWAINQNSWVLKDAIDYAYDNNVIVIAAAGNYTQSNQVFPASYPHVFSISAIENNNSLSSIANQNISFDYAIFGENLESTYLNNQYISKSGTSQSTAFFSGIIANILSISHTTSYERISQILFESSRLNTNNTIQYKTIDLDLLVQKTASYYPNFIYTPYASELKSHVNTWPNPAINQAVSFKLTAPNTPGGSAIQIILFDEYGKKVITLNTTYSPDAIITWNGKNNQNQYVKNGSYFYTIKSRNPEKLLCKGTVAIINT